MTPAPAPDKAIIYFDGYCGFCNGVVNYFLDHDPQGKLLFAPLQGETARQFLSERERGDLTSIVVTVNGKNYRKSAATVRILWQLGGIWGRLGTLLWLIPLPIRDLGYIIVARLRYRIAGRLEACRMPREGEQERFLP
ncbi:MAG TPA: DCC1-like thiol-disulfide oxidoreductase family protein [Planctomicrobium sp.]|nr:DCC1-like thiol-disulfide oxidoreductase family protein [Planctomicrobium sp.]